jgi:excisionase family DNA binding protein
MEPELAAKRRNGHKAERRHPKLKPQMNADERRFDSNTKARSSDFAMGLRRDKENAPHLSKSWSNDGALVLPPEERFFTKPELAKVMKVSVRCITDMMRRGEIRYLKINGHLVRFRLQDVNQRLSETVLCCEGTEGSETATSHAQHSTLNAQGGKCEQGRTGGSAAVPEAGAPSESRTRLRADASACATGGLRRDKPARHARTMGVAEQGGVKDQDKD